MPLVADWTGANTNFAGCDQPAWSPSNAAGNFLPSLLKANSCAAKDLGTDPHNKLANVEPGDLVVHTVDSANGNPAKGVANFLFKLPQGDTGTYIISGSVWDAGLDATRPQDFALLVNGVEKASGVLSGSVSRSEAKTFLIAAELTPGDTVELQLFKDAKSEFGFFVGVNMTIAPPACLLTDSLKYASGTLTMNFTIGTPVAATWNGWLIEHNTATQLWSQSEPVIEPQIAETKTHALPASGEVGILSTLTTPTGGINCSSWTLINTGTP